MKGLSNPASMDPLASGPKSRPQSFPQERLTAELNQSAAKHFCQLRPREHAKAAIGPAERRSEGSNCRKVNPSFAFRLGAFRRFSSLKEKACRNLPGARLFLKKNPQARKLPRFQLARTRFPKNGPQGDRVPCVFSPALFWSACQSGWRTKKTLPVAASARNSSCLSAQQLNAGILTDRACGSAFLFQALRRRVKKTLPPTFTGILDAFFGRKSFRVNEGTNPL